MLLVGDGGVVTLYGYFAGLGDKSAAIKSVKSIDGVERVIVNAFPSN